MTSRDFCYWLQGFFELNPGVDLITTKQAELIKRHLALVFKHEIDPSYGDQKHQQELNKIHNPNEVDVKELESRLKKLENKPATVVHDRDLVLRC